MKQPCGNLISTKTVTDQLHRTLENITFEDCYSCSRFFKEIGTPFFIHKHYKYGKLTEENAICALCREERRKAISEESLASYSTFRSSLKHRPATANVIEDTCQCNVCGNGMEIMKSFSTLTIKDCEPGLEQIQSFIICTLCLNTLHLSEESEHALSARLDSMAIFSSTNQMEYLKSMLKFELL